MLKLEVFDPAMCCATGICGNSVDPRLVTFAADLEWLKKKGVDVVRHGLSFEPAEFVKNETVKTILNKEGNDSLPIIIIDKEVVSKGGYPSREKLAEICKVAFNKDDVETVKIEESYACGPDCDCHASVVSNNFKKILFIVVLLIIAGVIAVRLNCNNKAGAAESYKNITSITQIKSSEDVAFIYIPTKNNEKISNGVKNAMISAQNTLKAKGISTSLYAMSSTSSEYAQVASQTTPPAILTIYKGKSKNYASGPINQTKLLQSYMTASMPGCGSGCPCHKK